MDLVLNVIKSSFAALPSPNRYEYARWVLYQRNEPRPNAVSFGVARTTRLLQMGLSLIGLLAYAFVLAIY